MNYVGEVGLNSATPARSRASGWQVGIRALILLIVVIAVWMTSYVNRRESARLETRIKIMQPLACDLNIADPSRIAVVRLHDLWIDDNRWDLYLPDGEYRVCVATRVIDSKGLPPINKSAPIKAGRHRLVLEVPRKAENLSIRLTSDGSELFRVQESKDWGFSLNSSGCASFTDNIPQSPEQPLVLFKRLFMVSNGPTSWVTPNGYADGIMVWVERVKPTETGSSQ